MFARYPAPGKVKTRLGRHFHEEMVVRLYRAFIEDLLARDECLSHVVVPSSVVVLGWVAVDLLIDPYRIRFRKPYGLIRLTVR